MRIAPVLAAAAAFGFFATAAVAQSLTVKGPDGQERKFTLEELAAMPHRRAPLAGEGGRPARAYEGVAVADLLQAVGTPSGRALRGAALADVVVVKGADGYRAAFGLAEMDPGMRASVPVLADRNEGGRLDAKEGPLRLVSPDDLRPARSVRGVVSIEVDSVP